LSVDFSYILIHFDMQYVTMTIKSAILGTYRTHIGTQSRYVSHFRQPKETPAHP